MLDDKTSRTFLSLSASRLLGIVTVTALLNNNAIGACAMKALRTGTHWELKLLKGWLWPTGHTLNLDTPPSQPTD